MCSRYKFYDFDSEIPENRFYRLSSDEQKEIRKEWKKEQDEAGMTEEGEHGSEILGSYNDEETRVAHIYYNI